jgi:hypothetical protein
MSRFTGKVVHRDLEGGFFELHTSDGRRYQLSGGTFRSGEEVTVEGEVRQAGFGFTMTGLPVIDVRDVHR